MGIVMALVDFIPVILFICTAVILQRMFYPLLVKGAYSLLAAGTICICIAGLYKATWKLLYQLSVCDFVPLNKVFFPMQTTGFVLAGTALLWWVFTKNSKEIAEKAASFAAFAAIGAAPKEFNGTMIFVTLMVLGLFGICFSLGLTAKRMKQTSAVVLFCLAFLFELMMGYLSTKDFDRNLFNWIAQFVNIIGQGTLLGGCMILSRSGFGKEVAER